MASSSNIMQRIANQLGPDLCSACIQNDVGQIEAAKSRSASIDWSTAVLAAASAQATDVLTYCLQDETKSGIMDAALWTIVSDEDLDPAYRFLVESNFVDVDREVYHMTGSMLGVIAGKSRQKRHSLMEYLLPKGASPNQDVDMHGGMYALTAAAGDSDLEMLTLLLDHGAVISGSGALILAALCGTEENVKCLLSRGANVNEMVHLSVHASDQDRLWSEKLAAPLHMAVQENRIGVIDLLLESGADLKLKDGKGRTAAEIAAEKGADAKLIAKLSQRHALTVRLRFVDRQRGVL